MKKNNNEVFVGMFVIVGFIFLSLVVFFISGVYFFRSGYSVDVMYEYVSILDKGAPVRMAGVKVGEVSGVNLVYNEEAKKNRVKVKLFIEKKTEIRENYEFRIQGTHILSEPHIEITPIPGEFPLIKSGSIVEGISPAAIEDLIERAGDISKQLVKIIERLNTVIEDEEISGAIKDVLVNLSGVMRSLNVALDGSEEDLKSTMKNVNNLSMSLSIIAKKSKEGDGTLGKLIMEEELYQEMRELVAEIKARPWRLMKKDKKRKFLIF